MQTTLRKKFEDTINLVGGSVADMVFSEEDSLIDMTFEDERHETDLEDLHLIDVMCWTADRVYITQESMGELVIVSALRNPPNNKG